MEDSIERTSAFMRINKSGQPELVRKKKGKKDEGTLSELADSVSRLLEYMDFGGQMPAMSSEQLPNSRAVNQSPELVASSGDLVRNNGDTITNMTGSTPLAADDPESSRAKSNLQATALSGNVRNKYIAGSSGDGIDYSATHSECVTGTAGIAIAPTQYEVIDNDDDDEEESNQLLENRMKTVDDLLMEWEPEFKAGEYSPGDYQMVSPTGDGVAKRKAKQDRVGAFDTDTSEAGKPFPGKHKDTAAMCDVDEDGVENEPQGSHESTHGEPTDGHQSNVGHDWPSKPKNDGSGVAEPFGGTRWGDGGVLDGGSGPDDEHYKKGSPGLPKDGPITGVKGPQMGQPMEGWSPEEIGQMLGDEIDIQNLFDNYARETGQVHLESFQELCDAHGAGIVLDESSLLQLMDANQEFMFHEHHDADGAYWLPETIEENARPRNQKGNRQSFNNSSPISESMISELQIRSPEEEAGLYTDRFPSGDPNKSYLSGDDMVPDDLGGIDYDEKLAGGPLAGEDEVIGSELGIGDGECPGCGYVGMEEECPECGEFMSQGIEEIPQEAAAIDGRDEFADPTASMLDDASRGNTGLSADDELDSHLDRTSRIASPDMNESLGRFMSSARSLIENSKGVNKKDIAETLNRSWRFYAGNVNAAKAPTKVQKTLRQMMESFPGFRPVVREAGGDAMESATGKSITTNSMKQSPHLNKQPGPDEMEQHGSKDNPLDREQKNTHTTTPIMKGTERGLTGTGKVKEEGKLTGVNAKILRENVDKLSKRVRNSIRESAKGLRGKHTVNFSIVVTEDDHKNRTSIRSRLVEAIADLEEILQFHPVEDVTFETRFKDAKGQIVLKSDVPLVTITPRGPIVAEGKTLFRFLRNAEMFANELVSEGAVCRIQSHAWGSAVNAKVAVESVKAAFQVLTEKKKWMQDVKNTGECTPMSKPSCTGRKKAFAKRVQKGGDLYSGKK